MEMTSRSHFLTQTIYSDSLKQPNPSNLWLTFWFSCLIDFLYSDEMTGFFLILRLQFLFHPQECTIYTSEQLTKFIWSWPTVLSLLFVGHFSSNGGLQIFFPHRNLLFILMFILGSYVDFIFL